MSIDRKDFDSYEKILDEKILSFLKGGEKAFTLSEIIEGTEIQMVALEERLEDLIKRDKVCKKYIWGWHYTRKRHSIRESIATGILVVALALILLGLVIILSNPFPVMMPCL